MQAAAGAPCRSDTCRWRGPSPDRAAARCRSWGDPCRATVPALVVRDLVGGIRVAIDDERVEMAEVMDRVARHEARSPSPARTARPRASGQRPAAAASLALRRPPPFRARAPRRPTPRRGPATSRCRCACSILGTSCTRASGPQTKQSVSASSTAASEHRAADAASSSDPLRAGVARRRAVIRQSSGGRQRRQLGVEGKLVRRARAVDEREPPAGIAHQRVVQHRAQRRDAAAAGHEQEAAFGRRLGNLNAPSGPSTSMRTPGERSGRCGPADPSSARPIRNSEAAIARGLGRTDRDRVGPALSRPCSPMSAACPAAKERKVGVTRSSTRARRGEAEPSSIVAVRLHRRRNAPTGEGQCVRSDAGCFGILANTDGRLPGISSSARMDVRALRSALS